MFSAEANGHLLNYEPINNIMNIGQRNIRYKTWAQAERNKFYCVLLFVASSRENNTQIPVFTPWFWEHRSCARLSYLWGALRTHHTGTGLKKQMLCFFFHPHHCYSSLYSIPHCGKTLVICIRSLKLYHPSWIICQDKQINYLQGNKASWFAASTRHWNTKSNTDWSCFFNMLLQ